MVIDDLKTKTRIVTELVDTCNLLELASDAFERKQMMVQALACRTQRERLLALSKEITS